MLPGIVLTALLFGTCFFSYSVVLFLLYSEQFAGFSNLLASLVSIFNFYHIRELYADGKMSESMTLSPVFILYNVMLLVFTIFTLIISIATYIYIFKKAANIELPKENDEVIEKINGLEELIAELTDKKEDLLNEGEEQKQVVWLCLTDTNDLYKEMNNDSCKLLLFNSATQIISFLKYLFAIKPKMQFKRLDQKFTIIIELFTDFNLKNSLKEDDIEHIDTLFDWLNFAGCRIPVIMYSENKLDKYLRMNLNTNYWNVSFINTKKELSSFFALKAVEKSADMYNDMNNILLDTQDTFNLDAHAPVKRRKTQPMSYNDTKNYKRRKNIILSDRESLTVLSENLDEE
jgi:hypothetical protein